MTDFKPGRIFDLRMGMVMPPFLNALGMKTRTPLIPSAQLVSLTLLHPLFDIGATFSNLISRLYESNLRAHLSIQPGPITTVQLTVTFTITMS